MYLDKLRTAFSGAKSNKVASSVMHGGYIDIAAFRTSAIDKAIISRPAGGISFYF